MSYRNFSIPTGAAMGTQDEVKEWLARQTDLVPCQALGEGKLISKSSCERRQMSRRHEFDNFRSFPHPITNPMFFCCVGCQYYKKIKVKRAAMGNALVRAGNLPQNKGEWFYAD